MDPGIGRDGATRTQEDTYWADDEELDLSIRYQINDNLEWFLDLANLGDYKAQRYGARISIRSKPNSSANAT
jgi:outer membrane receptor protein involved in Fe transport